MNQFVVQIDENTELYLQSYTDNQDGTFSCSWGSSNTAIIFTSQGAADSVAALINGGSVGTTKPVH